MENNLEVNEIVDKIIENLETSLDKLGRSLHLDKKQTEEEKKKDTDSVNLQNEEFSHTTNRPFASVRYATPDYVIKIESNYKQLHVEESTYIPIPVIKIPKLPSEETKQIESLTTFKKLDLDETAGTQVKIQEEEEEEEKNIVENNLDIDTDIHFVDIPKAVRLIHLYGPPGSAKSTFGLQSAIEISPRKTYYFITSHATSIIKRIKQICEHERWNDFKGFKQSFFPIEISNLEVLEVQLEKIEHLSAEEVGMVVIDHLTDYSRGQIHKEEKRKQLRELLERLYILADEKDCKILIINGYSYKDSAPAEDIVESFCDMSLQAVVEDGGVKFISETEEFSLQLDDSGVRNLHVNVYY